MASDADKRTAIALPKVELHLHLDGSLSTGIVFLMNEKQGNSKKKLSFDRLHKKASASQRNPTS